MTAHWAAHWTEQRLAADLALHLPAGVPLLAFSGGADSTALLHGLLRIESLKRLVVAHIDHGLDPESTHRARAAEHIARDAAQATGWRLLTDPPETVSSIDLQGRAGRVLRFVHRAVSVTEADRREHGGAEAAARALRYRALEELCAVRPKERRSATGPRPTDFWHPDAPDYLITAHHADDQLETLVLRLRQGTGLVGLAGIRPVVATPGGVPIHRPLLSFKKLSCEKPTLEKLALEQPPDGAALRTLLRRMGATWTEDPTNADLSVARNLVRRRVLPALLATDQEPARAHNAAIRLARAADRFADWRDEWARAALDLQIREGCEADRSADLDFDIWRALPQTLRDQALGAMHRALGLRGDPPAAARTELQRQLAASRSSHGTRRVAAHGTEQGSSTNTHRALADAARPENATSAPATFRQPSSTSARCTPEATRRIACAAGSGWQWVVLEHGTLFPPDCPPGGPPGSGARLQLRRALRPSDSPSDTPTLGNTADFTYTPRIPGVTEMPEIGCSLLITREPFDRWMTRTWPDRAACHLPDPRAHVIVRSRTTGDTLHPFGSPSKRVKLKKLLIDRKVPRDRRSKLPLVCVAGEIAWVPGVTIGDSFRIPERIVGKSAAASDGRAGTSDGNTPTKDLVWVFRLLPMDAAPAP